MATSLDVENDVSQGCIHKNGLDSEQQKQLDHGENEKPKGCTISATSTLNDDGSVSQKQPVSQDELDTDQHKSLNFIGKEPEDRMMSAATDDNGYVSQKQPVSQDVFDTDQQKSLKFIGKEPEDPMMPAATDDHDNGSISRKQPVSEDKLDTNQLKENRTVPTGSTCNVSQDGLHTNQDMYKELESNAKKPENHTVPAGLANGLQPVSQDGFETEQQKDLDQNPKDCTLMHVQPGSSTNADAYIFQSKDGSNTEQQMKPDHGEMTVNDKTIADLTLPATSSINKNDPVHKETNCCDHLLKEVHRIEMEKLPPKLCNIENLKQLCGEAKSFRILLIGKTGSGKSTLTNSVIGVNIKDKVKLATESSGIETCTTEVKEHRVKKNGIDIIVWDGPGLKYDTYKLDKAEYNERDLTMYCVRLSDIRFVRGDNNPDIKLMRKLTQTFEVDFWRHTIIVMTFANALETLNISWKRLSKNEKAKAFQAKIEQWKEQIRVVLLKDVNVPEEIVESIQMVPAGHYSEPHLPGNEYWLSSLWLQCLSAVSTPLAQAALVRINIDRFKQENNTANEDFAKSPEQQPIVIAD